MQRVEYSYCVQVLTQVSKEDTYIYLYYYLYLGPQFISLLYFFFSLRLEAFLNYFYLEYIIIALITIIIYIFLQYLQYYVFQFFKYTSFSSFLYISLLVFSYNYSLGSLVRPFILLRYFISSSIYVIYILGGFSQLSSFLS